MPLEGRAKRFQDDFPALDTVSKAEMDFIDEKLEWMMSSRNDSNQRAQDYRDAILNEFGIDLSSESFGRKLPTPIGVAAATYTLNAHQVENLFRIGIPFAALKTVVAQGDDGVSVVAEGNRGSVWQPDKEILDWPVFRTGERGSEYEPEAYVEEILKPSLRVAAKWNGVVTASVFGPAPANDPERYGDRSRELTDTLRKILNAQVKENGETRRVDFVALDFSPYFTQFKSLADDFEQLGAYYRFLNSAVQEACDLCVAAVREIAPAGNITILPKINSEMLPILRIIVAELSRKWGTARFIGFNRERGVCADSLKLEPVVTAFGGPTHLIKNIYHFIELGTDIPYEAAYTGGVITGADAVAAFASGNISRIEMVSIFFFQGVRNSFKRVLGGFTVNMLHLSRTAPKRFGFEIRSVEDLKGKFHHEAVRAAAAERFRTRDRRFVAFIDEAKCKACRQPGAGQEEPGCRVADNCPHFAFERLESGKYRINPKLCHGCGTCVPEKHKCGAIELKPV